jgi:hypothetical protein
MHSPEDDRIHYRKDGAKGKKTLCDRSAGPLTDDIVSCTVCKAKKIAGSN